MYFILLWGLTLFTGRRLWVHTFHTIVGSHSVYQYTIWLHTFHTIVGSHSVYQYTIVASYISYYCGVSLCLPVDDCGFISYYYGVSLCLLVDDCGFIHFILVWDLTVYRQTIVASYISYYCGVSLCLPVDDCRFIHFILLWGLTLFTSRRLWLNTLHTIVGSHSVYQQTIVASYISYYCGVSLCLPVDNCGFIHFILLWGRTLFTSRRLWLHTFHTIVGSHSVYRQTIVASYISYYCGVSLCLPVEDCGLIHFILLWGLTLFTSRRLWLHSFHTIVGSHSVYQQTIVASYISYYCGVSLCLPVEDCGFIHFILLWGLTLFIGRRLWLHIFHTIVGSHSVYRQTIVASYISYYCGVSLCLPLDDCGFMYFILLWGLTLFTGRRLWVHTFHTIVGSHSVYQQTIWLHTFHTIVGSHSVYRWTIVASFHTIVGSHSVYQQTIVASYISYYCGVSLCLPVDDCGFIHFILVWDLTLFTGRRLWLHTFHFIVGSHSVYQYTIVASYISYYCGVSLCLPVDDCGFISYYCGVSLCLPVDDCGFIHFILLWGLTLFTSRRVWLHSFHTIVGSHSVYQQTIVASYISYYCGVSLSLPVDDCGFIHFILV